MIQSATFDAIDRGVSTGAASLNTTAEYSSSKQMILALLLRSVLSGVKCRTFDCDTQHVEQKNAHLAQTRWPESSESIMDHI